MFVEFLSLIWKENKKGIMIRPEKDGLVQDALGECTKPFKILSFGGCDMSSFSCVGSVSKFGNKWCFSVSGTIKMSFYQVF